MKIISRKEAISKGLKRYFTGEPCKRGHITERKIHSRACPTCTKIKKSSDEYKKVASKSSKLWRNTNKQFDKERKSKWQKDNPEKCRASVTRRNTIKKLATPTWLSKTQKLEINKFKDIAKWYDPPMVIDHIIPLQGDGVCGLHVPWNLQLMTKEENISKGNKYDQ